MTRWLNLSLLMLLCTTLVGGAIAQAADPWKAEAKPAPNSEQPVYCPSITKAVQLRVEKVRAIKEAVHKSEVDAPTSVFEMFQRMDGTPYQTAWQKEQLEQIEKIKAELHDLSDRYRTEKCGSIDVDKEIEKAMTASKTTPRN